MAREPFNITNYQIEKYGSIGLGLRAEAINPYDSQRVESSMYAGCAIYDGPNGTGNILYDDLDPIKGYTTKVGTFTLPPLSSVEIPLTNVTWGGVTYWDMKSVKIGYVNRSANYFYPLQIVNY